MVTQPNFETRIACCHVRENLPQYIYARTRILKHVGNGEVAFVTKVVVDASVNQYLDDIESPNVICVISFYAIMVVNGFC